MTPDRPSVPLLADGAQISPSHVSFTNLVRIFWHVPNAILTSSATSLIVRRRSARMISRARATVSSVWEVEGLSGRGVVFKGSASTLETEIPLKCLRST